MKTASPFVLLLGLAGCGQAPAADPPKTCWSVTQTPNAARPAVLANLCSGKTWILTPETEGWTWEPIRFAIGEQASP